MDFSLTKEQKLAVQLYREFAEKEVKPYVEEMDETEKLPDGILEKMARAGFFGIPFSREIGGAGADYLVNAMCVEEISKISATVAGIISVHTSLTATGIQQFGTQEQKEKYLPDLVSGRKIGAFALTEPGAGSDASGQQTQAKLVDDEHYVINGTKIFITNSGFASIFIVACMTDKSKGNKGISTFIVEKGTPGFIVGKEEKKCGIRASSTCELIFDNCVIPKENMLGKEGKGLGIMLTLLDGGRVTIAAQAVGIAQGAIDETIKYVKERKQFGRPISFFQNTQFQLAEMQTKIDCARLMLYKACVLKDAHAPYGREAAMAKLYCSDVAVQATRLAVQLHGGYGYTREYPVERMYRDAKITEIYEGTSEVQKMVIAGFMGVK